MLAPVAFQKNMYVFRQLSCQFKEADNRVYEPSKNELKT